MKKLLSCLLIASTIFTAIPAKKAEAGVVLLVSGSAMHASSYDNSTLSLMNSDRATLGNVVMMLGYGTVVTGIAWAFANPVVGVALIALGSDGSLPRDHVESALAERYSFISDREVITDLASAIKLKADSQEADQEGKKIINLSSDEVMDILAPLDLTKEEIAKVVNDLK